MLAQLNSAKNLTSEVFKNMKALILMITQAQEVMKDYAVKATDIYRAPVKAIKYAMVDFDDISAHLKENIKG